MAAQYCGKQTYSFKDGINQPYNYSMVDSRGKLWVDSRGGGINMFDGKKWTNFTEKDGLLYTWGTPIFEDKEGGIWISHSYEKGLSRYINNSFTQYVMPSSNLDSLGKDQYPFPFTTNIPLFRYNNVTKEILTWKKDSTNQIWMYPFDFESKTFRQDGIPFFEPDHLKRGLARLKQANKWIYLINDSNGDYLIVYFTKSNKMQTIDRKAQTVNIIEDLKKPSVLYNAIFHRKQGKFAISYLKNGKLFLKDEKRNLQIKAPKLKQYGPPNDDLDLQFFKWSIHHYYLNQDTKETIIGLWKVLNPEFENSYLLAEYDTKTFETVNTLLFSEDKSIGIIAKDNAGTYWYCNGSTEVRLFPNQHWIPTGFQGMPAEAWSVGQTGDHKIWFGSYSKQLVSYDGTFLKATKDKILKEQIFMDGNESDKEGNLYFTTLNGILKFNGAEESTFLADKKLGFYLNRNNKGELMFGSQKEGLWILPNNKNGNSHSDWKRIDQKKGLELLNVVTATEDTQGNYWMGRGSQGLAIYFPKEDKVYNWIKEKDPNNYGVQSIDMDKYGNIWLGTDNGLCFFNYSEHNLNPTIDFQKKLEPVAINYTGNSIVQVCKIYNDSTLIVGNGIGYFLINLDSWYDNPRQLDIQSFTDENGHQAGGIVQNGIWIDHRKDIWMMAANGVIRHTPHQNNTNFSSVPNVEINHVFVGETEVNDLSSPLSMGSSERNITLKFQTETNNDIIGSINYRYRLHPTDDWSKLISTDYVNFYNLSVGDYQFEVIAERNGYQSPPADFDFTIEKAIYQEPIFFLIACLLLFGFGVNYSLREQKLQANERAINAITKEKEALQIQTIVNQLNPHFINNALQWLQIRLDKNHDEEAVRVVGKLSENISTVFQNSRTQKVFHPLQDELKLSENYLYIQKIRFKEKLVYEIPTINSLKHLNNVYIPLLMLQIHIENAIEHGIRNKAQGGKVTVTCNDDTDYVFFNISDNGVGRKAAEKIGSHGTQNGLAMLEELMEIYNKKNKLKLTQEFIDDIYTDEYGIPFGTKVIVKIPKNYNYKI